MFFGPILPVKGNLLINDAQLYIIHFSLAALVINYKSLIHYYILSLRIDVVLI